MGSASGANGGAWFGATPFGEVDAEDNRSRTGVVHVSRREERYTLVGATRQELAADLRQRLPGDEGFTGWTRWRMSWSLEPHREGERCAPGSVNVHLEVTRVLPEWEAPPEASSRLKRAWNRYLVALEDHEEEHAGLAEEAAEAVHGALRTLAPRPGCTELTADAEKLAQASIDDLRKANAALDEETGHGARDGAVFPAPR